MHKIDAKMFLRMEKKTKREHEKELLQKSFHI